MSQEPPPPDRRHNDDQLLAAINGVSDRLVSTERSLNRQLEGVRQKQERQLAMTIELEAHKTIEKTDEVWATLVELRTLWETTKAVSARLVKFCAWGCGVLLALAAVLVGAVSAGIIHFRQ